MARIGSSSFVTRARVEGVQAIRCVWASFLFLVLMELGLQEDTEDISSMQAR